MSGSEAIHAEAVGAALLAAVAELRDALETITGVIELGAEAVFVRSNLDKATEALGCAARALDAAAHVGSATGEAAERPPATEAGQADLDGWLRRPG